MLPQAVVPNSACGPVEDGGRLPSHVSPRDPHASRRRDTLAGVAVAVAPGRRATHFLPPAKELSFYVGITTENRKVLVHHG